MQTEQGDRQQSCNGQRERQELTYTLQAPALNDTYNECPVEQDNAREPDKP